jgi:hypothetical protein
MHKYGASDIRYAQIFMLFAPLTMITFVTTAIFEVRFDFRFSNITKFVPPFVTFAALVTLVQIGAFTPVNTALAYMLPPAAMSIYMLVRLVGTAIFQAPARFWCSNLRLRYFESVRATGRSGTRRRISVR